MCFSLGPGDFVDNALKKCQIHESKCIIVFFIQLTQNKYDQRGYLFSSGQVTGLVLALTVRSLPPSYTGAESFHGTAHPAAMCPAVPPALQLGPPSPQTHQAAQLRLRGDRLRGQPGNIYLHLSGMDY